MTTPNQRLREARKNAGYDTASEAAEALSIPVPTYIQHENGGRGFPASRAPLYARKFKVTEQWLLYGKGAGPDTVVEAPLKFVRMSVEVPSAPVLTAMFAGMLDQIGLDPNEDERAEKLARIFPGALEAASLPHVKPNSLRRKIRDAQPRAGGVDPSSKTQ